MSDSIDIAKLCFSVPSPQASLPPICLESVCLSYGEKSIFSSLSMQFSAQGMSFLVGENGAGKTQLLRLIHGLVNADAGQVKAANKLKQAYLPQVPLLLNRSVQENLYYIRGTAVCQSDYFNSVIDATIDDFELRPLLSIQAGKLSGGQRKRVAIARLFLQQSDYYLLDEPSANLDYHQNLLLESKLNQVLDKGKKIIMSSHDYFQLERLFTPNRDEIWLLKAGDVLERMTRLDVEQLKKAI